MWIAKRPFKSAGRMYERGQLITDPSDIKLFKSKCNEGKIIRVPEHPADQQALASYFELKYGVVVDFTQARETEEKIAVSPVRSMVGDKPKAPTKPKAAPVSKGEVKLPPRTATPQVPKK